MDVAGIISMSSAEMREIQTNLESRGKHGLAAIAQRAVKFFEKMER